MSKLLRVAPLMILLPLAGACASASATTKGTNGPDLVVPPPPPHMIPINAEPLLEPVGDVPAPPAAGTRPPARAAAPKSTTSESKPEPKAAETKPETPAPDAPPAAPATPPAPAPTPQLRTSESSGAEAAVRASLDRTRNLLNNVDYGRLSNVRKKAYDDANRFSQQAEKALKDGNAVFAQGVATKAETLARELAGK